MSDQQAYPPHGAPAAGGSGGTNITKVHSCAVQAEKYVEQLATELGQVPGIDPAAIKAVTGMADVLRRISSGLGKAGLQAAKQAQPTTVSDATDQMMAERAAARQ